MRIERWRFEVDALGRSHAHGESRQRRGDQRQGRMRRLEKEQPIVGHFSKRGALRLGSVPDAALLTRTEARAMAQWWVAEGGEEQIVQP